MRNKKSITFGEKWASVTDLGFPDSCQGIFCLSLPFMQCLEQQHPAFQRVIQTLRVSYRKSRISSDLMSCAGLRAPVCSSNPQPRERHCNRPSTHDPMAALAHKHSLTTCIPHYMPGLTSLFISARPLWKMPLKMCDIY